MRSIKFFFVLIVFVSACGGGGSGSSDGGGTSDSGAATSSSMDADTQAVVEAYLSGVTSHAASISSTVGGAMSGGVSRTNERIDIVPIISGGTVTGVIIDYVDHRTEGSFSGYTSLNGRVVGSGDATGGDAQSEGLTREFVRFVNDESARWTFDGILNEDISGALFGGSSPFLIGRLISTLGAGGFAATDNDQGDVYIFDDMKIQVNLQGDEAGQSVSCLSDGGSYITLHKSGGSLLTCFLNSECTGCL